MLGKTSHKKKHLYFWALPKLLLPSSPACNTMVRVAILIEMYVHLIFCVGQQWAKQICTFALKTGQMDEVVA